MNRNYLIVALRNFWKHKVLSLINIVGLAIGISASLVIYLIVSHDFSYDKFHPDRDLLYRVVSKIEFPDLTIHNSGVPAPTAAAARQEIPGLASVTIFRTNGEMKVSIPAADNQNVGVYRKEKDIIYADPQYFETFQYKWLAGSRAAALANPHSVVLAESKAKKYFPGIKPADIIGRQVIYDDTIKTMVNGIVEDFKETTHFTFGEFISLSTLEQSALADFYSWKDWNSISSNTQMFVKLDPGMQPAKIEKQLAELRNRHRERRDKDKKDDTQHFLQSLNQIHFNTDYDTFEQRQAHLPTLYGLLAVASFLLLLGCINFINLATAHASTRSKEIGIRKTLGGSKANIRIQFLSETFVLTLLATIVSIFITPWLLMVFGDFIPPAVTTASVYQWHVWLFLLALILAVSLLSGYYPAYILSKMQPMAVLNQRANAHSSGSGNIWLRKILTTSQFVIAQFLLIATLVVSKQVRYSLSKDLGYKKDAIVYFSVPRNFYSDKKDDRRLVLQQKLKALPGIEKLSLSAEPPASGSTSTTTMEFANGDKKMETMVEVKFADTAYFNLYGMKLVAGNNLQQSDTTKEYVINETYAKLLGFKNPADAVGKFIERDFLVPVTGVISDFHTKSTHEAIKPLAYSSATKRSYTFHLALPTGTGNAANWSNTLAKVEREFKSIYPEEEFSYSFYDDSLAKMYKAEQDATSLLQWASGLCLLISALGMLGLVIFITNSRTKEIGVRKVLGASVSHIVMLLSKDFLSLVLLAFLIALPLSWIVMNNWLQDFAYRTNLSWWLFALSGLGMMVIAIVTLSIRTIKAATANPVESLKVE